MSSNQVKPTALYFKRVLPYNDYLATYMLSKLPHVVPRYVKFRIDSEYLVFQYQNREMKIRWKCDGTMLTIAGVLWALTYFVKRVNASKT